MFEKPVDKSFDIEAALRETFHEATYAHAARMLRTPEAAQELREVVDAHSARAETLERLYHETYDARVEAMRAAIYDDTARFDLPQLAPLGAGATDNKVTEAAHRLVQQGHLRDRQKITEARHRDIDALLTKHHPEAQATPSFNRTAQSVR
ncbi:MAG: hypothetical protein AAGE76_01280 [Pseudomonadota bacterium]